VRKSCKTLRERQLKSWSTLKDALFFTLKGVSLWVNRSIRCSSRSRSTGAAYDAGTCVLLRRDGPSKEHIKRTYAVRGSHVPHKPAMGTVRLQLSFAPATVFGRLAVVRSEKRTIFPFCGLFLYFTALTFMFFQMMFAVITRGPYNRGFC
jgi:hypothetical protein